MIKINKNTKIKYPYYECRANTFTEAIQKIIGCEYRKQHSDLIKRGIRKAAERKKLSTCRVKNCQV